METPLSARMIALSIKRGHIKRGIPWGFALKHFSGIEDDCTLLNVNFSPFLYSEISVVLRAVIIRNWEWAIGLYPPGMCILSLRKWGFHYFNFIIYLNTFTRYLTVGTPIHAFIVFLIQFSTMFHYVPSSKSVSFTREGWYHINRQILIDKRCQQVSVGALTIENWRAYMANGVINCW